MDEDGFYIGELNDVRGLVPSNFLHPANINNGLNQTQMNSTMPMFSGAKSTQLTANSGGPGSNSSFDQQSLGGNSIPRPKGVVFSDATAVKKPPAPLRQTSQQGSISGGVNSGVKTTPAFNTGGSGMTTKANKIVSSFNSTPPIPNPNKQLTKKTSDLATKALSNSAKKSSSGKKADSGLKVKFFKIF